MYKITFSKLGGSKSVHMECDGWESLSQYKAFLKEVKGIKEDHINEVLMTVFDQKNKQVKKLMRITGFRFIKNKWAIIDDKDIILSYYQLINKSEEVHASNIR